MTAPDYRIDGFEAASDRVKDDFGCMTVSDDMYAGLAAHHTADGRESFLLFYDGAAVWDVPGTAEYIAMHIERGLRERTFTFDYVRRPTVPLTQNWLITRGCPPEKVEPDQSVGPRPADALTSRLEDLLRTNPEGRYTLLDHYTHNPGDFGQGVEVSTLLHDRHPDAAEKPYRLFLEETSLSFETYTVREGAFSTAEDAWAWLSTRNRPLPPAAEPPNALDRRAVAAHTRTTTGISVGPRPAMPEGVPAPAPSTVRTRKGPS